MAEEKPAQKLEQRLTSQPQRKSPELIREYVGKQVVMELGGVVVPVCSGTLVSYDGRFVKIGDFKQHEEYFFLENMLTGNDPEKRDLSNPKSVAYSLPSRTINVNLIASIQNWDDVVKEK